ncbi:ICOS ligand-like isoform X1 [Mauremys reevesii]|uniref:ICOS ligand-like isoform X1 n=1 Tax=Mauremys reevesii TaxID=260615 RepID=UPI00193F2B85|nr:ICOS ligand-like isoform X1 [Mauremys reevesii]XP_039377915.1 ICOS ligand-like isoform X1 [Mauremys reevesii]XP_039377916.1 ICOS ligand-like isoform X1 [Mauremys reevesii]XP_039377927.1 ICOS ligand-like isoform X1 [Mauremys reevesii]XP_039377939.1 ICOS ligand-like isoform X1 [Mauremys reevesii]
MAAHSSVWILAGFFSVVLAAAGDPVRIEADEGEDVLLPCIVERRDADRLPDPTVNWQRSGSEVVNSYYNGKNHPVYQSGRYKGRTEFASQGLSEGNASLLLKNVTPADFGNYTCHASLYENSPQTLQTVLLMQKKTQGTNVPGGRENRLRILSICVPLSALVILVGGSVGYCWWKKTMKSKAGDAEAAPEMEEFTRPRNSENTSVTPLH